MNKNGFQRLGNVLKKVLNDIRSSLDRYTHLEHCSRIIKLPREAIAKSEIHYCSVIKFNYENGFHSLGNILKKVLNDMRSIGGSDQIRWDQDPRSFWI